MQPTVIEGEKTCTGIRDAIKAGIVPMQTKNKNVKSMYETTLVPDLIKILQLK